MNPKQTLEVIDLNALLKGVSALRARGARLVQIGATTLPDKFELTYSFDVEDGLASLRVEAPREDPRVPSISSIYGCAYLYENEMHDLFGIKVEGMALDFHGTLYKTKVKFAFGQVKAPAAKPPSAPKAPAGEPALAGVA